MIIVTGGAGFIGSNLVRRLNESGRKDILVVDNLKNGAKFRNLVDCEFIDYIDKQDFLQQLIKPGLSYRDIELVFHQGACSKTTEWDGRYMLQNNYEYSKQVLAFCEARQIPLIYASSAAVYGTGTEFKESRQFENPINVYAYSKFLFDQYVRQKYEKLTTRVIGLRYFNVYGPRESHKGSMASVAFHLNNQIQSTDKIKLFQGCDGYADGEQLRDFIHVDDVTSLNLWFAFESDQSGIFNVGTGEARAFNDVANSVIKYHKRGKIEYIPFPDHLRGSYQSYTCADLDALRNAGYDRKFTSLEQGMTAYLDWLAGHPDQTQH